MIEWQVWMVFMTHLREPHDYLRHRLLHPWRVNWLPGPDPVSYLTPLNPQFNHLVLQSRVASFTSTSTSSTTRATTRPPSLARASTRSRTPSSSLLASSQSPSASTQSSLLPSWWTVALLLGLDTVDLSSQVISRVTDVHIYRNFSKKVNSCLRHRGLLSQHSPHTL